MGASAGYLGSLASLASRHDDDGFEMVRLSCLIVVQALGECVCPHLPTEDVLHLCTNVLLSH